MKDRTVQSEKLVFLIMNRFILFSVVLSVSSTTSKSKYDYIKYNLNKEYSIYYGGKYVVNFLQLINTILSSIIYWRTMVI